jgi:uncharacterized membrane-anchored protein YjiN (DUF445 family)
MKRKATGLLVASVVVFVVARILEARWSWLGYVRATAEAAIVGGLADWFAVTALFRHPLGIPIPHTAIVPRRKDRVGVILGNFVERHFLSPAVIASKLRSARIAEQLAKWITEPENAQQVARQAAIALAAGARATRQETVEELIEASVVRKIEKTPVAPLLGRALTLITANDRHHELFDEVIAALGRAVSLNRDFIRERIDAESPWWIPEEIDEKIAGKVVRSIDRTLKQIREDPQHPMRERFDTALAEFIDRLQNSPEVIARAEEMKRDVLNADAVRAFSGGLWDDVRDALERQADKPQSHGLDAIARGVMSFGHAVQEDQALLERIDRWIVEVAAHLTEQYRDEAAALIAETVAGWDPIETSERIELAVGRDLQFIRINGTLVGGLAGLLIYTLTRFF